MPLTVITLKNSPPSLRGDLTKWMQEISTGVYVGNFNMKIRTELWKRVVASVGTGEATMSYACRNEIGYNFETHNSRKIPINFDGIPLVFTPSKNTQGSVVHKHGFSTAAKMRKAKKYGPAVKLNKESVKPYVIIDLETTGLNPYKDRIIEIAAQRVGQQAAEYTCFVQTDFALPNQIKKLTGITETQLANGLVESLAIGRLVNFIGEDPIVGYNISFDIKFINEALKRQKKNPITNKTYDVMKYVKQDKKILKNYKLETVLKEYKINAQVPHRASKDVKIIHELIGKLKTLIEKLK